MPGIKPNINKIPSYCFLLPLLTTLFPFLVNADIALPTSAPIDVFSNIDDKGYGTIQMTINLELKDDPEGLAGAGIAELDIGSVDFKTQGLIYTKSVKSGSKFEDSYTIGTVEGKLTKNQFTTNLGNYNNTYDQSGFYIGYRPSYSGELFKSDEGMLDVRYAYTYHLMLFYIEGDYTINLSGGATASYGYDESSTGVAFKPTIIIQPTWYLTRHFALTFYAGAAAFAEVDLNSYENKMDADDYDSQFSFNAKEIQPIYGYDITIKGIFSSQDSFNVSSTLSVDSDESEDLREIIVRYQFPIE